MEKYDFEPCDYYYVKDSSDCKTLSFKKKDIVIYFWIYVREGIEINLRKTNWRVGKSVVFVELFNAAYKTEEQKEVYYKGVQNYLEGLTEGSTLWVEKSLEYALIFIETNFPEIFEKGELPSETD